MNDEKFYAIDRNEELIKKGLERSCDSLGFFLKEKVDLETLKFSDAKITDLQMANEFRNKEIVLYSEIIGEVSGQCFFLLDMKEADILFRKNFPSPGKGNQNELFETFLLELDNIITASVVTEFANFLHIKIYGGVPGIFYQNDENKMDELVRKAAKSLYSINFKCRYKIESIEFSPMFFWVLESKFIDMIQEHSR